MSEQLHLPPSEEVAVEELRHDLGNIAIGRELDQEWWDDYVASMPQTD